MYEHSTDYILITNLMHWLFIHKILFSSTCFEPQVLIFRRVRLYTCSIWYCHSLWEFLVACRYTASTVLYGEPLPQFAQTFHTQCVCVFMKFVCLTRSKPHNQRVNQQMHVIKYNSWKVPNSYIFWHWGAILWEPSRTKECQSNTLIQNRTMDLSFVV